MQALQHGPVVIQTNIKDKAKFAACNAMPVLVNRPLPDEDGRIQKVAEVHLNRYPLLAQSRTFFTSCSSPSCACC